MDNRILTIDSLIDYCKKNKLSHFSSKETGKPIVVNTFGNISYSENSDPSLMSVTLKACHCGVNRNNSKITEEVMKKAFPTFSNKPILAEIIDGENGEKDFGSHSFTLESDENGEEYTHYIEKPVGIIPETNNIHLEYDEDQDKTYTIVDGYIFNYYGNETSDIIKRKNGTKVSVELEIYDMAWSAKDKVLVINDFSFTGITLLGEAIGEGMLGSRLDIADFSKRETIDYSEQLIEMQERLKKLEATCFNIEKENYMKGGTELNKENFEEEVTTEEVTDTEESEEEVTNPEEESEETVEESSTDNSEPKSSEDGDTDGDVTEQFENMVRTFEVSHEDIKYALYNLLSAVEENDNDWYYITNVYDSYFVYENWDGGKIYGQKYTVDNDNVVTFDGERYVLVKEYLTEEEYAELQTMRVNYSSITEKLAKYEEAEELADKITIFDDEDYADYLETEEFKSLMSKETLKKYSKEELKEKADAAFGRICKAKKKTTFAADNNVNVTKKRKNSVAIFTDADSAEDSIYGDYFKSTH